MNKIDKDIVHQELENSLNTQNEKEKKEKKIIDESRNSVFTLAEKVLLQPVKKWLESLKNLIIPEKLKQEVRENIDHLEKDKQNDKKNTVLWSKSDLYDLKKRIIPLYYWEYAEKWPVEAAKSKAAQSLILDISKKDPNPVLDVVRKVAEWWLS